MFSLPTLLAVISLSVNLGGVNALGTWVNIGSSGVVCVASAFLPNSRMLCYERPHMTPYPINQNTQGMLSAEVDLMATNNNGVWTTSFTPIPIENNPFCSGLATLPDGSIFIAGGDNQSMPTVNGVDLIVNGRKGLRTYDPCPSGAPASCVGKWTILNSMTTERWYPTVVTLADGSVIIIGGQTKNIDFGNLQPTDDNPTYEYYPAKTTGGTWPQTLQILQWAYPHNLFAPAFLLPSGRIFLLVSNKTIIIDPTTTPDTIIDLPDMPVTDHAPWIYPHTPTMMVLPMTIANNFSFALMICGGNYQSSRNASAACMQINPDDANPAWSIVDSMINPRLMPDSVLLPDGNILMVNGLLNGQAGGNQGQVEYAIGPIYDTELFTPTAAAGSRWSVVGTASNKRLYHSGAFLLESGHVVTVGSEMNNYNDFYPTPNPNCFVNVADPNTSPLAGTGCTDPFNYNIERFAPDYLNNGAQPVITSMPTSVTHGSLIQINVDSSTSISRVTMVRSSALTHSTNTDQRFIELVITARNATALFVQYPTNPNMAVPGNWMTFVLNAKDVPSQSVLVSLQKGAPTTVTIPSGVSTATVAPSPTPTSTTGAKSGDVRSTDAITTFLMSALALFGLF